MISWKAGSHINKDVDVVKAHAQITRIENKHGECTASLLLDASKAKNAACHKAFDWNDKSAAHKHRLATARDILRSIEITYEESPDKPIRAFQVVRKLDDEDDEDSKSRKVYISTDAALSNPEYRAQILLRAQSELQSFKKRYSDLNELSKVFLAIDTLAA